MENKVKINWKDPVAVAKYQKDYREKNMEQYKNYQKDYKRTMTGASLYTNVRRMEKRVKRTTETLQRVQEQHKIEIEHLKNLKEIDQRRTR